MNVNDRIKKLQKELQASADSYYQDSISLMTDKEYDAKFDELRKLEEEAGLQDGFTAKVGATAKSDLPSIVHKYPAKSLDKTKEPNDIIKIHADKGHDDVVISWKLDGSTVQLTYQDGKLITAATRGDGEVGTDITRNAPYIKDIPTEIPARGELVVRGEVVMLLKEFDRLCEEQALSGVDADETFKNARNLANSTISAKDTEKSKSRETHFKAFEFVAGEDIPDTFMERLEKLSEFGFQVVEHQLIKVKDIDKTIQEWSDSTRIENLGYLVDGLVFANNDASYTAMLEGTNHHPHRMKGMAFKWQDETKKSILLGVEWSPSRTGLLNPVAVYEPVSLCGTTIERASLHNISYMNDLDLRVGDSITVYKANMIIPQLDENLSKGTKRASSLASLSAVCPCCGTKALITEEEYEEKEDKNGNKIKIRVKPSYSYCPNLECPAKMLGVLKHFVSKHGMDIDGLAENSLKALMDQGYVKNPSDLYTLAEHEANLAAMEGRGERSTKKLLGAIEASKKRDFSHFLYACGIPGIGRGQIKVLKEYMDKNYNGNYLNVLQQMADEDSFNNVDGIGAILAETLKNWIGQTLRQETSWVRCVMKHIDTESMVTVKGNSAAETSISGKAFCITGSLEHFENRDACVAFIEQNGGKFVSGVSKKTDYLVNNDITSTSGKNKKAKELGIPIITEQMLIDAVNGDSLPTKA